MGVHYIQQGLIKSPRVRSQTLYEHSLGPARHSNAGQDKVNGIHYALDLVEAYVCVWRRWLPKIARELTCLKKSLPFPWRQACLPANLKDRKHSGIINSSRYSFHLGGIIQLLVSTVEWQGDLSWVFASPDSSSHSTGLKLFPNLPSAQGGKVSGSRDVVLQNLSGPRVWTDERQNACKTERA